MTPNAPDRPLVLAVDGGQSSTMALLSDLQGRILAVGRGGPSNHIHEPGGPQRLESALRDSTQGALTSAGLPVNFVTHICLGMTGAPEQARPITEALFPTATVQAYHDTITALAGASVAKPGVVVIAGTGAVAYGRLDDGREARSSGWGYTMGDEGSGYWLAVEAIRVACKAEDGRGQPTELLRRIPEYLHLRDLRDLHRRIYSHALSRGELAALARVVTEAARAGDECAQKLLRRAGDELAQAALAVIAHLGQLEAGLAVYTTGGVFQAGALVLEPFGQAIAFRSPNSPVYSAEFSPVVGALFLALRAAGVALDRRVVDQISDTLPADAMLKGSEGK